MRFDIGILAGSGPEAGIDLWQAVLDERRRRSGPTFRGDLDAPSVVVRSDPRLGLSMELERHGAVVREVVLEHAAELDTVSSAWAIACNTINLFVGVVDEAGSGVGLVSFPAAVERWLDSVAGERVTLLGGRPVAELGELSPYRHLADRFDPLPPAMVDDLHRIIEDTKRFGPAAPRPRDEFAALCAALDSDHLLLACTELPLIAGDDDRFVDVTRLVAAVLLDSVAS